MKALTISAGLGIFMLCALYALFGKDGLAWWAFGAALSFGVLWFIARDVE